MDTMANVNDHFSSPEMGSIPTTHSVSESIIDQSGTFPLGEAESDSGGDNGEEHDGRIAICGIGLRLPGGIRSCDDYWNLLHHGRDARGPIPHSRYNLSGFDSSLGGKDGIRIQHGYFLSEDLAALDTSMFSLTRSELEKTDPQQRMLLQVTRECLDDAAETEAAYRGGLIGCYVGTFGDDWLLMGAKDTALQSGAYSVTGAGDLMLANRVSYEYDFRGPSMAIKTGCSASLVALHEACRAIQSGDATAAVVAGTSIIMTPTLTATMAAGELLSPEGSCKTFDAAADGFARAEAITAIYVKRLEDALRDGNPIRAVIRASATNSDGRGQSLVTPNGVAQEALMRKAYELVGLDPSETAYVECHGTGTPTGDPIEAHAVGRVFGEAGVFIGSVKPNLGHSEGSSGVSSVIKCVLALENKTIPPNIKFGKPNPKINFDQYKLTVPVTPTPFPQDRAERISINSFGIGGTNAHVILESWPSHRNSFPIPPEPEAKAELLILSANTEPSLTEDLRRYREYIQLNPTKSQDVAYTKAVCRQHFPYRSFAVIQNGEVVSTAPAPVKMSATPLTKIAMIFSGQGAQWPEMGKELVLTSAQFCKDLEEMDGILGELEYPPGWKLLDELLKPKETSRIHTAELAQPLCTALQICLVNQFTALGVQPTSVAGHSSGEIAAAYAAGYLSMGEAIVIAYYRGRVMTKQTRQGAMAAIGLGANDVRKYLGEGVVVACENSPNSSTISGDKERVVEAVDAIQAELPDVLARLLKVDMAYHSHHMTALSDEYLHLLSTALFKLARTRRRPHAAFVSSVTTKLLSSTAIPATYWVDNLTSPVRFSSAITNLLALTPSPFFLEIGPHSTLSGPLRQINPSTPCVYAPSLLRNHPSRQTFLSALGTLFQYGYPISFRSLFSPDAKPLSGLPAYPWDHSSLSQSYWNESRISRTWRSRKFPTHCLLGQRVLESPETEPVWRAVLSLDEEPWLADHKVQSDVVFPVAGWVSLAGEAVRQLFLSQQQPHEKEGEWTGYKLKRVVVHNALLLPPEGSVEILTSLRKYRVNDTISDEDCLWWEFSTSSFVAGTGKWTRHCDGRVRVSTLPSPRNPSWDLTTEEPLPRKLEPGRMYDAMAKAGFNYGPAFRALSGITTATTEEVALGKVALPRDEDGKGFFTVHPATIDACLQLLLAARSKGLARNVVDLAVPTAIEDMEVAAPMGDVSCLDAKVWNEFGRRDRPVIECQSEGKLVLRVEGLELRPIADDTSRRHAKDGVEDDDVHAAARLHWMPDFDFVDHASLFGTPTSDREETRLQEELSLLCIIESARRLRYLNPCQPHFAKFRDWLNQQVGFAAAGVYDLIPDSKQLVSMSTLERMALIQDHISQLQGRGRSAVTTGVQRIFNNIDKIFTGEVDTLDTLLQDQILARIYDVIGFDYSAFIRTLAHSRPQLRILEVGAGTGGTTETILKNLGDVGGFPSYACYTFTDVSVGFFPAARERFSYAQNLEFKALDISRDPLEQGFEAGTYDLILAANVIHATPSLQDTLRNLCPLLRGDGMLVMTEICSVSRGPSYIFGNFSGWWLGEDDGREDKPHVGIERWDSDLKASGFTGVDTAVYDEVAEDYRQCVVIVSHKDKAGNEKVDDDDDEQKTSKTVALLTSQPEASLTTDLTTFLCKSGWSVSHFGLSDAVPANVTDIICLLDLETPFFTEMMTPSTLTSFQTFLKKLTPTQTLLWLTPPSQIACSDPRTSPTIGLARTIRSELALHFVTLEISRTEPDLAGIVSRVLTKARSAQDTNNLDTDKEFAVHEGSVQIGRYRPFSLSHELSTAPTTTQRDMEGNMKNGVILDIAQPGNLTTLSWHSFSPLRVLPPGHVEIAIHAAGVNFRDVVYAAGLLSTTWNKNDPSQKRMPLGLEVSGVVSRAGPDSEYRVGEKVMAFTQAGGFASHVVVRQDYVLPLPSSLSESESVSVPVSASGSISEREMTHSQAASWQAVYATVVYALLDAGRLQPGMSVLIHSACGGVGLAAMEICNMLGAVDVFCTVGSERKISYLMEKYGIPREKIFSSRDAAFKDGVLQATGGEGVDLVLNSLSGELLHASWRCVAPNGKMLELGKRDLSGFGKLDMSLFLDNRSYCGIDVAYLAEKRPHVVRDCLKRSLEFYKQGLISPLPITEFDAVNVKHAFRHLQAGEHIGKVIVKMPDDPQTLNAVAETEEMQFRPDASYLLVGGAGGLGRSMAIWLVEHGARHLVFLSRSAGLTESSRHLATELESMGCTVTMIPGSVTNPSDITTAIDKSPAPIRGVFQLAMVQRDSPFITMTFTDWKAATDPKISGTWNLHNAFLAAPVPLDIFWLASSTVTVVDQPGQGNYKSGCTFTEAFCQYRHSLGLPASVLSICPIDDVGFVAENAYAKRNGIAQGLYFLGEREFLDFVDDSLRVQLPSSNDNTGMEREGGRGGYNNPSHIIMGLRSGSDLHLDDDRNPTNWRRDRRMGLYHNRAADASPTTGEESSSLKAFLSRIAEADKSTISATLADAESVEFLAVEIGKKVHDFLLKPEDVPVDTTRSLAQMGLDSLTAIELRRWFRQAMGLQVTVLEIMGVASLKGLGEAVAGKLGGKFAS